MLEHIGVTRHGVQHNGVFDNIVCAIKELGLVGKAKALNNILSTVGMDTEGGIIDDGLVVDLTRAINEFDLVGKAKALNKVLTVVEETGLVGDLTCAIKELSLVGKAKALNNILSTVGVDAEGGIIDDGLVVDLIGRSMSLISSGKQKHSTRC